MTVAKIENGKLICKECGPVRPALLEIGYTVTHELVSLGKRKIAARGWNGDSKSVSESGTALRLECPQCFAQYDLPDWCEVNWK